MTNDIERSGNLSNISTQELRDRLASHLDITAKSLIEAAKIVAELESRGEDLSDLKFGIVGYLRKIACNQLLPEVVSRFVGHYSLRFIATLPISDQRACLSDDGIKVGAMSDGEIVEFSRPILAMDAREVRQVFAFDHIRSPEEQVAWIRSRMAQKPSKQIESPTWTVSGSGIVVHRPAKLSKRDVQLMLKAIS